MKKLLLGSLVWVSLCLSAAAAPYTSAEHHFQVTFAGPVKIAHPRLGQVTYGHAPGENGRDWEAVSVLTGRLRKSPVDTLNYLVSEGVVKSHAGPVKEIHEGKAKGIEMLGLDERGFPFGIRILSTAQSTYVLMSCNLDLGVTQAFFHSFHLIAGK